MNIKLSSVFVKNILYSQETELQISKDNNEQNKLSLRIPL